MGLIGLWEAYERYNPEKGKFTSFAIMYVRGKMMTLLLNKRQYADRYTLFEDDVMKQFRDDHGCNPLELELLLSYMNGLTEGQKIWMKETFYMQKIVKEIADDNGVSVERVKSWRRGALKKLRQSFTR